MDGECSTTRERQNVATPFEALPAFAFSRFRFSVRKYT